MKGRFIAFFVSAAAVCASLAADPAVTFSGKVKTETGLFFRGAFAGRLSSAAETVSGTVDASSDAGEAFVTGDITFNAVKAWGAGSESAMDGLGADLKEAWYSWTSTAGESGISAGFRIGRQITAWGKADEIQIADVLCPQDLTTLGGQDYSETRIGIDALKLTVSGSVFSADAYWIPSYRPSMLPLEAWNPLRSSLIPESVSSGGTVLPVTLGKIVRPELSLANGSYAARAGFWLPAADFSFYGYYGFDDKPIPSYAVSTDGTGAPSGVTVNGSYYRYGMAGADIAVPVKEFVFRGEAAFFIERALARKPELAAADGTDSLRKNQILALAGVDWNRDSWTVMAQVYEDAVLSYDDSLDRGEHEPGCTLHISRTFFSETLTVSASGSAGFACWDSYAGLSAEYALNDQITLSLDGNAYFPGPDGNGKFGKYKDLSSVSFTGIFRF